MGEERLVVDCILIEGAKLLECIMNRMREGVEGRIMLASLLVNPFGIRRQFIVETIQIDPLASIDEPLLIGASKIEVPE